ncbi:4Fe-4S dicluster domain-containing protein, partial [uncultured Marinobacter sp.]|uniref:4Fe-4S dicluster domain-containing protein n=1 Tax=uncultured Marinobacter sp. TaxID=187379 RepID=UPI002599910D
MQTNLVQQFANTPEGQEAESILRACVHCGFCTATCPTYQELNDERDGPRGRIYLMKMFLEGEEVTEKSREHLDRCLTCRSCETTCPSGVKYGRLVDISRGLMEQEMPRPPKERWIRWLLARVLPNRRLFGFLLRMGQLFRPVLPSVLRTKVPPRKKDRGERVSWAALRSATRKAGPGGPVGPCAEGKRPVYGWEVPEPATSVTNEMGGD